MNQNIASNVVVGHEILKDSCLTVHINLSREFRIRLWIARQLLKLTGFILGIQIKEKIEDKDESHQ